MLRVVIWNLGFWLHRSKHAKAWDYLRNQIKPDLALLQEVGPTKMFKDESLLLKKVHSG